VIFSFSVADVLFFCDYRHVLLLELPEIQRLRQRQHREQEHQEQEHQEQLLVELAVGAGRLHAVAVAVAVVDLPPL
jgi:hypothetical protein